jgi:hypothetical protein
LGGQVDAVCLPTRLLPDSPRDPRTPHGEVVAVNLRNGLRIHADVMQQGCNGEHFAIHWNVGAGVPVKQLGEMESAITVIDAFSSPSA